MEKQVQKVISQISKELKIINESVPAGRRYSKELKRSILGLLDTGVSRNDISKLTGLGMTTIANWQKTDIRQNSGGGCFREISVVPDVPQNFPSYTIETPLGYKIHLSDGREIPHILKAIERC